MHRPAIRLACTKVRTLSLQEPRKYLMSPEPFPSRGWGLGMRQTAHAQIQLR